MRRSIVLAVLALAVTGLAPTADAVRPVNACIAKTSTGPCKSAVLNVDNPISAGGTNPQFQAKKVAAGRTGTFFIKLHNPNRGAVMAEVNGTGSNGSFTTSYKRGRTDVTPVVTGCQFLRIGGGQTAVIVMHVHVSMYATPPPFWELSFRVTDAGCSADHDVVW